MEQTAKIIALQDENYALRQALRDIKRRADPDADPGRRVVQARRHRSHQPAIGGR